MTENWPCFNFREHWHNIKHLFLMNWRFSIEFLRNVLYLCAVCEPNSLNETKESLMTNKIHVSWIDTMDAHLLFCHINTPNFPIKNPIEKKTTIDCTTSDVDLNAHSISSLSFVFSHFLCHFCDSLMNNK